MMPCGEGDGGARHQHGHFRGKTGKFWEMGWGGAEKIHRRCPHKNCLGASPDAWLNVTEREVLDGRGDENKKNITDG